MSELQADDSGITYDGPGETPAPSNEVQPDNIEPDNAGSELATDSPVEGEQNTDVAPHIATVDGLQVEGPEGFKKAIDKQHFKFREEQRRANDLEERLNSLESQNKPVTVQDIAIPPMPETWDENYDQKMRERDAAIGQNATNEAVKSQQAQANAEREQEQQREEVKKVQKLNTDFVDNANKLGVNKDTLATAQQVVVDYGVSQEIAHAIITDPNGPLIIQHLAANPLDLYDLSNGNSFQSGQKWTEIQTKSAALKPKTSSTPKPSTSVNGGGAGVKERGPKGATFE